MQKLSIALLAVIFLAPASLPAQELNPEDFRSVKAKRAIREYLDRGEKATKEFLEEKEDATKDLIEELEKVLKSETAAGNLDEAIKLRKSIRNLEKNAATGTGPLPSSFEGRWKIQFNTGDRRDGGLYYDIVRNGDEIRVIRWAQLDKEIQHENKAVLKEGAIMWTYKNGERVERFHLDGDRLMVEHWYILQTKNTDSFPTHFGIGERVDD